MKVDYKLVKDFLLENRFFMKNGHFSKTAAILMSVWIVAIFKFLFATCVVDFTIYGINIHWPIVFNWADTGAMTGAASALYFAVHNHKDTSSQEPAVNGDAK